MLPDTGRHEERYRLTGRAPAALGAGLFGVLTGILFHSMLFIVVGGALALFYIVVIAGHRVTFRADNAGITLGVNLTGLKLYPVNIPWADVEKITLYSLRQWSREDVVLKGKRTATNYIGIQRREGAPPLVHGNQPAAWSPEPRIAAGATRPITTWQLDRDRLAATLAVVAPAIHVVDYGIIDVKNW
jgi:hypothetical protein